MLSFYFFTNELVLCCTKYFVPAHSTDIALILSENARNVVGNK